MEEDNKETRRVYYINGVLLSQEDVEQLLTPTEAYWYIDPEEFIVEWRKFKLSESRLERALREFEEEEMYELCSKIQELINEKKESTRLIK